jgi:hypothetical protein
MFDGNDLKLPLALTDFNESPIMFANHFLVEWQPDEFVLAISQLDAAPIVGDTLEERRANARAMGELPVHTLSRVAFTRRRLIELVGLLQDRLREHDRALGEREKQPA